MSLIHHTSFITSAHSLDQCLEDSGYEIAFAGRSNAGKSTAINALTRQKNLCKTSKTPGRTQLINFFKIKDDRKIVDLPGYGYAKVPKKMRAHWEETLSRFLLERQSLKGVVIVVDIRRGLSELDQSLIEMLYDTLQIHIILAKSDKLSKSQRHKMLNKVKAELENADVTVQTFSATSGEGIQALESHCYKILDITLDM
ncbi:MAG: YihA family ribosome biogenesis GTP-binding protein [Gammaproteobacteria bacterium]|nr:YihA family ribosome biogenesis GTP-binding protein [Gammaproteobacteria bacterium]